MEKTKTGIKGFDELIGGGFPFGKTILLSGAPGTGKTIFALQYLYNGASQYGEKGLYVSFEENSASLRTQAAMFGWDFKKLEDRGQVIFWDIAPEDILDTTANSVIKLAKERGVKRLIIDSLPALAINTPVTVSSVTDLSEIVIRRFMYRFISKLRSAGVTTLLISPTAGALFSREGVSEFASDGIIHIKYEPMGGQYSRYLTVPKMRQVANDEDLHPLEIGKTGIVVHNLH